MEVLSRATSNSVDAIVTDPPYGLSFMGKKWDYDVPSKEIWEECLRVLKPGGYLLAFAGTRTQHRMAVNIEDAGFEIRDMIAWVYGSGFPKSLNIGKAVDKLQGNEREVIGDNPNTRKSHKEHVYELGLKSQADLTKGNSEWEGWGTALKPALEPITVARKPLSEKNVAENVLKWGTGGINIDGSRVETEEVLNGSRNPSTNTGNIYGKDSGGEYEQNTQGRFPANLIHDGSDEVVELFPASKSTLDKSEINRGTSKSWFTGDHVDRVQRGDSGSAARFFYCAKASKSERNKGCEGLEEKNFGFSGGANQAIANGEKEYLQDHIGLNKVSKMRNNHPTVKPIALMEYLVKLVTKEGATVLDPFAGSGTTLIACKKLGRNYIGIEREEDYVKIAEARLIAFADPLI